MRGIIYYSLRVYLLLIGHHVYSYFAPLASKAISTLLDPWNRGLLGKHLVEEPRLWTTRHVTRLALQSGVS